MTPNDRADPDRAGDGRGHRADDVARIRQRFMRLGPQQRALVLAIRPFSDEQGRFDRRQWADAFVSAEPRTIHEVIGATGTFERLVNHLNGMLAAGARLAQLLVADEHGAPTTPAIVKAVRDDGGLTPRQAEVLIRLNRTRNRLQHASLDVEGDEIHADIELLRKTLKRLVASYVEWLGRHGVRLLESPGKP
jgi:hypothetical protein